MEFYAAIKKLQIAICNDVDGTRGYYVTRNMSIRERQLSYDLSDMRNLRGRVGGLGGRGGKNETRWDQAGRQTIRDSYLRKQTEGGQGWGVGRGWLGYGHWERYVLR